MIVAYRRNGEPVKLGNLVEKLAKPIAVALKLPCIDPVTKKLKPESGCAKRRDKLNSL